MQWHGAHRSCSAARPGVPRLAEKRDSANPSKVKNLASHVLGKSARRIKDDWLELWGYSPLLLETFVDPQHYLGSCYRAANWEYLGMTRGEGLVRKAKSYTTTAKMIFVKPLVKDFRSLLCSKQLKGRVEK